MSIAKIADYGLRLDATFLIVRLIAFTVAAFVASEANVRPFAVLSIIGVALAVYGLRRQPAVLPYAFLLATALWGGVTAALAIDQVELLPIVFAATLGLLDGSAFVSLRCRGQ